jgi:hypothetical protein
MGMKLVLDQARFWTAGSLGVLDLETAYGPPPPQPGRFKNLLEQREGVGMAERGER